MYKYIRTYHFSEFIFFYVFHVICYVYTSAVLKEKAKSLESLESGGLYKSVKYCGSVVYIWYMYCS